MHSREVGGSTEDRSRSRSSRSSPSLGGEICGERCCARSQSGWPRARSRSRSTTHLWSRGCETTCGLGGPGCGLQTHTGLVGFAHALRVTVCGLDECTRALLAVTRPSVTVRVHTGTATGLVTITGHGTGPFSPLTVRSQGIGVGGQGGATGIARRLLLPPGIAATLGQGWRLPLRWRAAPVPCPRLLCRTSPGCSSACQGPLRDAVVGSLFSAAGVTGAGVLPGPAAPVMSSAPSECLSVSVPARIVVSPAGAASAIGSAGQHECAWEFPRSERRRRRSSRGERFHSGKKRGEGRSPSPACSSRSARVSASSLSASSGTGEKDSAMPPPPAGRPGVDGGRSGGDLSASGRDCSPRPGLSGLGSGLRSSPSADQSRSEYGGRSSPTPSGAAEDDRSSNFDSADMDRDDSFSSVPGLPQFGGTGKCSPEPVQDFFCTGLQATIRVFPGSSLASFHLTAVSPGRH